MLAVKPYPLVGSLSTNWMILYLNLSQRFSSSNSLDDPSTEDHNLMKTTRLRTKAFFTVALTMLMCASSSLFLQAQSKPAADLEITLNLPGLHNVQNALAAIAVGMEIGAADKAIVKALAEFRGVGRRFQRYGEVNLAQGSFTLIDDYGHHPAEMAATISAARGAFPNRRLVLVFQPHRYTRTRDCF